MSRGRKMFTSFSIFKGKQHGGRDAIPRGNLWSCDHKNHILTKFYGTLKAEIKVLKGEDKTNYRYICAAEEEHSRGARWNLSFIKRTSHIL